MLNSLHVAKHAHYSIAESPFINTAHKCFPKEVSKRVVIGRVVIAYLNFAELRISALRV
jgi:hypothetical protein